MKLVARRKNTYTLNNSEKITKTSLSEIELERDLGLLISNNLKWHFQAKKAANQVLSMLIRTFVNRNTNF